MRSSLMKLPIFQEPRPTKFGPPVPTFAFHQFTNHQSPFTCPLRLRRHWPRFSVLVNGNVGKDGLGDFVASVAGPATAPRLDSDRHRCFTYPNHLTIEADFIPDKYGFMEYHAVNRHGYTTAT